MLKNGFRELAFKHAGLTQGNLIDWTTEEAVLLNTLPMAPSSHGIEDKFGIVTSADRAVLGDFDAPLTALNTEKRMDSVPMKQWQGLIEVGVDQLKNANMSEGEYFMAQAEGIIKSTCGDISLTIHEALKAFAVKNYKAGDTSRVIDSSGSANTNYSINAVKWVQSDTSGLYNATGWGNGNVFDITKVAGGSEYLNSSNQLVKARVMKLQLGLRLANPLHVTSIVNIDKAANLKTIDIIGKIAQIIEEARNADALYMHPSLKRLIGQYITFDKMQILNGDKTISTIVDAINNCPIITDYNIKKGTEANVSLA